MARSKSPLQNKQKVTEKTTPQAESVQSKFQLPALSFDLTQQQRQILAGLLTVAVVLLILGVTNWFTNPGFRQLLGFERSPQSSAGQISDLDQKLIAQLETLTKINPEDIVFQTVTLDQLPVYPQAWVERYFSQSERVNNLVSGPAADPDNDKLSNKEEYLYGSDPRNKDTLCSGKPDRPECSGKNDGENVRNGISPLTGLSLEELGRSFKIKRSDFQILDRVKDSFEQQAKEGIDFPTLYQLSRAVDLNSEFENISVNVLEDTREGLLTYSQKRLELIKDFINNDELTNFIDIYKITNPNDLASVRQKYIEQAGKLKALGVPRRYLSSHKAYVLVFDKLIKLIEHRQEGLKTSSIFSDGFKADSKKKAVEVVWAYRKVNEEVAKLANLQQ
jgi:hypothetical protein